MGASISLKDIPENERAVLNRLVHNCNHSSPKVSDAGIESLQKYIKDNNVKQENFTNILQELTPPPENIPCVLQYFYTNNENMQAQGGAATIKKYKGRIYKIRKGTRGGKYILVEKKKVYV